MYDHRQNLVTDPVSVSNLPIPEAQRRIYDEESRVSTDSDLDLTDFDDDDEEDGDDYLDDGEDDEIIGEREQEEEAWRRAGRGQQYENRSTFSGVLMRKLRVLEEQQQQQQRHQLQLQPHLQDDPNSPAEVIRPPLLAVADDSFSAKMRRVLKWTHSLPSDAVSESSESNLCSPAMIPAPMLSTPSTQSRKRRLSDALFADDDDTSPHHQHHQHHITLVLKRPRISGVFSPSSAPGSPFFSSAPRLHPFPISTSTPAPALPVFNHTSRSYLPKSCDYVHTNTTTAPPMADVIMMSISTSLSPTTTNTGANTKPNPIGDSIRSHTIAAARLDKGALHVCAACDHSFASPQCFIRHWHGASTPDACRAAVSYGLGLE